jgi:hypothetical protein
MASRTAGYDNAHGERKDDDLDRWRFAAELVEVIQSTPIDWSARIGVFGKWGEGKSTIASLTRFSRRKKTSYLRLTRGLSKIGTWDGSQLVRTGH